MKKKSGETKQIKNLKAFISRGLYFAILLFFSTYIFDSIISASLKYGYRQKSWEYIYSGNADCELAIFGSSRAIFHLNSKIIEDSLNIKTWNFGFDGACIDLIELRLSEYLKNCKQKPQYITLVLDWQSFPYANMLPNHYQMFPYILFNYKFYEYLKLYEGYNQKQFLIPLIRYPKYTNNFSKKDNAIYIYNGFCTKNKYFNMQQFKEEIKKGKSFEINYNKFPYFKSIVNNCISNNIKLNIIIAPEYIEGQAIVSGRDKIISNYRQWAETDSLPFIDFSNDSIYPINKDTAYFYNCMHLNSKGADKFTSEMYVPYMRELINGSKN